MADGKERAEKRLSCVAVYCGSSPGKKPIYEQVAVGESFNNFLDRYSRLRL